MDLVTVITANYNCGIFLREALESVLNQTHQNIEYIVVDDGSTDNSKSIINEFSEKSTFIKPIFLKENTGVANARNQGLIKATGTYITFLDADDYWSPNKISKQLEVFRKYPEAGLVSAAVQHISAQGEYLVDKKNLKRNNVKQGRISLKDYLSSSTPTSINSMTRKECIEKVGMFNTDYVIGEDYELWMRIINHYEYYYIDIPLSFYRMHDKNAIKNKLYNRQSKLKILEDILKKNPGYTTLLDNDFQTILIRKYNTLGRLFYAEGKKAEAQECFKKAVNIKGSLLHKFKAQLWLLWLKIQSVFLNAEHSKN